MIKTQTNYTIYLSAVFFASILFFFDFSSALAIEAKPMSNSSKMENSHIKSKVAQDSGKYASSEDYEGEYELALFNLRNGNYDYALKLFREISEKYPFSAEAINSLMSESYINYISGNYDEAIGAATEYIELYPTNEYARYMYFIRAISSYAKIQDVRLDQAETAKTIEYVNEYIHLYGIGDPYGTNLHSKLSMLYDQLAAKKFAAGVTELKFKNYLGALFAFGDSMDVNNGKNSYFLKSLCQYLQCLVAMGLRDEAIAYYYSLQDRIHHQNLDYEDLLELSDSRSVISSVLPLDRSLVFQNNIIKVADKKSEPVKKQKVLRKLSVHKISKKVKAVVTGQQKQQPHHKP